MNILLVVDWTSYQILYQKGNKEKKNRSESYLLCCSATKTRSKNEAHARKSIVQEV